MLKVANFKRCEDVAVYLPSGEAICDLSISMQASVSLVVRAGFMRREAEEEDVVVAVELVLIGDVVPYLIR